MKFAAVCITEGRPDIFGLAIASFFTQHLDPGDQAVLYVEVAGDRFADYEATVQRFAGFLGMPQRRIYLTAGSQSGRNSVPGRFGRAFRLCSDAFHSDVFLMWDDDDWAPPERLLLTKAALSTPGTHVCGYDRGHFCNLRTQRGYFIESNWGFWGGSLAFDRRALAACDFESYKNPGYDQEAVRAIRDACPQPCGEVIRVGPYPIAFCHGLNVATLLADPGVSLIEHLQTTLPLLVWDEVERLRRICVERRIFPPQPEGVGEKEVKA